MNATRPVLLVALALAGCPHESPREPSSQPGRAVPIERPPDFNGRRAYEFLTEQTAMGPRNPGSPAHAACLSYLTATLSGLADSVRTQPFTATGYDNERLRLTNVIAMFRPGERERILLCAHWDTRPRADRDEDPTLRNTPIPGANDGASGVAVLLELSGLMKERPPPVGVDIVLFDGEDYGMEGDLDFYLLGSRHYARMLTPETKPDFGILLDMVGDTFLEIPQERHSLRLAPHIVARIWRRARHLGISQFVDSPGHEVYDDHIPLNEAGIPTVNLIDFDYPDRTNRYWHTHQDTPDKCSPESLEAVGTVLTHIVYAREP